MFGRKRRARTGLSCQELVELVTDYLEGAMTAPTATRFESHLDQCPGCRAYLDQMRRTIHLIGRLRPDDVPAGVTDVLLDAFRSWNGPA